MKQSFFLFSLLLASLIAFFIYCSMWIDWLQDIRSGVYMRHHLEGWLETGALLAYTYLAFRFAASRLKLF